MPAIMHNGVSDGYGLINTELLYPWRTSQRAEVGAERLKPPATNANVVDVVDVVLRARPIGLPCRPRLPNLHVRRIRRVHGGCLLSQAFVRGSFKAPPSKNPFQGSK